MNLRDETLRQTLEYFLTRMAISPDHLHGCQVLQGGVSGAGTYRLQLDEGEFVCKITGAQSEPFAIQRARRESLFYQQLAPLVPLRVPELAARAQDERGEALLLKAYHPAVPAAQWREADFVEAARQIATLHAAYLGKTQVLADCAWLPVHEEHYPPEQVQQAREQWQALQAEARFAAVIPPACFERVTRFLPHIPALAQRLAVFPLTLCHGDCHSDNVLRDDQGRFIWADWQEVSLGIGPGDLSFFTQRAFVGGGAVPYAAMLSAYQTQIKALTKRVRRWMRSKKRWTSLKSARGRWPGPATWAGHPRSACAACLTISTR